LQFFNEDQAAKPHLLNTSSKCCFSQAYLHMLQDLLLSLRYGCYYLVQCEPDGRNNLFQLYYGGLAGAAATIIARYHHCPKKKGLHATLTLQTCYACHTQYVRRVVYVLQSLISHHVCRPFLLTKNGNFIVNGNFIAKNISILLLKTYQFYC
jgi:hypothetical protein